MLYYVAMFFPIDSISLYGCTTIYSSYCILTFGFLKITIIMLLCIFLQLSFDIHCACISFGHRPRNEIALCLNNIMSK